MKFFRFSERIFSKRFHYLLQSVHFLANHIVGLFLLYTLMRPITDKISRDTISIIKAYAQYFRKKDIRKMAMAFWLYLQYFLSWNVCLSENAHKYFFIFVKR